MWGDLPKDACFSHFRGYRLPRASLRKVSGAVRETARLCGLSRYLIRYRQPRQAFLLHRWGGIGDVRDACDEEYRFILVDVGSKGKLEGEGGGCR